MTTMEQLATRKVICLVISAGEWSDEVRLRSEDGEEITALAKRANIGYGGKSDLYWAQFLKRRMEVCLTAPDEAAGGSALAQLDSFRRADQRSIAQEVSELERPVEQLAALTGLIDFRVATSVPRIYSERSGRLVDMLEVIRWADGSASQVEHYRNSFTGALVEATMLPPCDLLSDLSSFHELDDDPQELSGPRRHALAEMMTDVATISRCYANIREHLEKSGHGRSYTALRVVTAPAALLSFAVRQRIIQALLRSHAEDEAAAI